MVDTGSVKSSLSWDYEKRYEGVVAGVDEAGRGCLAGPVVAAAVVFLKRESWPEKLNDSKKLSRKVRRSLFEAICSNSDICYGVGRAEVEEIDRMNILQASFLAMKRAVEQLSVVPEFQLLDGSQKPKGSTNIDCLVKGDGLSPSIAAASILAKESRDRFMEDLDTRFPGYGFAVHKGYGTAAHMDALQRLGPCKWHRMSFAPVRQLTLF